MNPRLRSSATTPVGPAAASIALSLAAALLAFAAAVALPTSLPLSALGPAVVALVCLWFATSARYELTLTVLAVYIGLVDGYLRLKTGVADLTIVRDLLLYSIVVGALARFAVRGGRLRLPPLAGWVLAFVAVAMVQLLNPANQGAYQSLAALRPHLEWVPLFFLGFLVIRTTGRLRGVLVLLVLIAAVNGAVSLVQFGMTPEELSLWGPGYAERIEGSGDVSGRVFVDDSGNERVRPFGLGSDSGFPGAFGSLAAPAALALLALAGRRRGALLVVPLAAGVVAAVVTSQSRTAVVASVVAVIAYLALVGLSGKRARAAIGLAVGAVLAFYTVTAIGATSPGGVFDRYDNIVPGQVAETTVDYRRDDLSRLPEYLTAIPLGAGLGSGGPATTITQPSDAPGLNAETQLNYLVIELGIPGLLVMGGFLVVLLGLALGRLRRIPGSEDRLLIAAIAAPLFAQGTAWVAGITTSSTPGAPYFWLAAGILSYWLVGRPAGERSVVAGERSAAALEPERRVSSAKRQPPSGLSAVEPPVLSSGARLEPPRRRKARPSQASRLLITVPWGDKLGGAEMMLDAIVSNLAPEDVDPVVVFLASGAYEKELAAKGIRTATVEAGRLRHGRASAGAVRQLAKIIAAERPDVILNWTAKSQLYGAPASVISGYADRVVWWQHSIPGGHWMDRAATLLPARAVGCSSAQAARAQQALRPRRPTFVVHPGVNPPRRPAPGRLDELRRELGISPEALILGIVGRLQPWKGQDRFLRVLGALRAQDIAVHGIVVGGDAHGLSPEYQRELPQLVAELGLNESVTMTGQVSDPIPLIALMDILVSASDHEPFGLVILEAMALGVPVVAPAEGGPVEALDGGLAGALARSSDPSDLLHALDPLVRNAELRTSLGQKGRRRFHERFTAADAAARFTKALRLGSPAP